jgi:putative thioredoxin
MATPDAAVRSKDEMEQIIGEKKPAGADIVYEAREADFGETVIRASEKQPVIVDFWAPWCEPCKTLMPALEKAVRAKNGALRLAKVNVDENPGLAQQLRIQSIPAVFAFYRGRPVDGFMGAVPESQLAAFVARVAAATGPGAIEELLEQGRQALKTGDIETAAGAFGQALEEDAANPSAVAGMARCLLQAGQPNEARAFLSEQPQSVTEHAEVVSALAAIALKERAASAAGEIAGLEAKVAADPADHQARIDLAAALAATGARDAAIDQLIASIKRERGWNDDLARKELLKLFEAFGPADPATLAGRRKLSSVLFS